MKFLLYLLISAFTFLVAALPVTPAPACPVPYSPPATTACTGGSYESCTSDVVCIASFPEGCKCRNNAKLSCAAACKAATPKLDDCTVPPNQSLPQR
ncbi:hypothetical protein Q9L58_000257 [Maublancomyces gigas]|uniref:Uncharacterized protein n=1 Tax=Discina gigas TaxID=1032678 RepID=A0ABR3GXI7_9PEZI